MLKTPFLAIRDLVIFPNVLTPIYVGRPSSVATLEKAIKEENKLVLGIQKDPFQEEPSVKEDFYEIGVIADVVQVIRMPNNNIKILVEGSNRVRIKTVEKDGKEMYSTFTTVRENMKDAKETEAIYRKVFSKFEKYVNLVGKFSSELILNLKNSEDYSKAFDLMATNLGISSEKKYEIFEITNVRDRGYKILETIVNEMELASLEKNIDDKVKKKMSEAQRSYYLREKISALKEELGDFSQNDDVAEIVEKLEKATIPTEVRTKLETEVKRLSKLQPYSPESAVIRNYIETVLDLPWENSTEDIVDLKKANEILERDHYALKDAKEKVLDFLAVKKLKPTMNGQILCLAGPPGIGKTSLVKSIAESMGRKFVRVSLGGVRDEAEIRGHRRTYIGSMPGKIMKAMKEAGTNNPVILLDEIDKMSNDFKGDPASAMLEVLDPEQNKTFEDHFIDMPFDLSKVFFVATANDLRTVSAPLRDRMDILTLSSYTEYEKLHIAQKYLLKQAQKENGLENIEIKISDKVMFKLIDEYTREAGVRNLKREIIAICRKIAREVVENNVKKVNLKASDLEKYLGKAKFRPEKSKKAIGKIGVVNGLAWTAVGGVTLDVQAVDTSGKGEVTMTGTLGNVMKESVSVATTYVKANLQKYKPKEKDFFKERAIHLHFPEGATPKDGPSAGITITTALISVLTNRPVRQDIAMTGEITITGDVLAIGGVREKVIGAHRAGIKEVILPDDNRVDTDEIPDELKDIMKIHFAKTYDDVSKLVFVK
jgi:endopeptidase La